MVPRFGRDPHAEAAFLWNLIAELQDDQLQFSVSDTGVGLPITYLFSLRRPSPFPVIQYARIDCLGGIWPIREGESHIFVTERDRATGHRRESAISGLPTNMELLLQSLSGSGSTRNAGILLRFELCSEKKLLLQTVWRRERDSNPRYPFG